MSSSWFDWLGWFLNLMWLVFQDVLRHMNRHPLFAEDLVSDLIQEILDEEILPDTLMEALNEYDLWVCLLDILTFSAFFFLFFLGRTFYPFVLYLAPFCILCPIFQRLSFYLSLFTFFLLHVLVYHSSWCIVRLSCFVLMYSDTLSSFVLTNFLAFSLNVDWS